MRGTVVFGNLRFSWAAAALLPALAVGCAASPARPGGPQQSWTEKVSASVKGGTAKLATAVAPKPATAPDNSLQPNKKAGPAVYVALAEMHERNGNIEEAETQLRKALAVDPNHLGALMAYAHLEDRQRNFLAATRYYQRALKKHSKNATVHNDLGLCYHRHGKLEEAAKALRTAVELEPHKKLYRGNLAAVLVDQSKTNEALAQLVEAHGQPVGHYNLAYLLVQKKDMAGALAHFQRAAQLDPAFTPAHQWVAQLSRGPQYGPTAAASPAALMARRDPQGGYAPGSTGRTAYPAAAGAPPAYPPYAAPGGSAVGPAGYPAPAPQQTNSLR
jgi:Flp pilus assembly protein TadD